MGRYNTRDEVLQLGVTPDEYEKFYRMGPYEGGEGMQMQERTQLAAGQPAESDARGPLTDPELPDVDDDAYLPTRKGADRHPPLVTAGHMHSGLAPHAHQNDANHDLVPTLRQCSERELRHLAERHATTIAAAATSHDDEILEESAQQLAAAAYGYALSELDPAMQQAIYQHAAAAMAYGQRQVNPRRPIYPPYRQLDESQRRASTRLLSAAERARKAAQ